MTDAISQHPFPTLMAAFRAGLLSPSEQDEVQQHLAHCAECRHALQQQEEVVTNPVIANAATATRPSPAHGKDPAGKATLPSLPGVPMGVAGAQGAQSLSVPAPGGRLDTPPLGLTNHPRYRVVRLLGAGGMGAVYEAEHRLMERRVALKVIGPSLADNPSAVARFHREVRAAAQLTHPNIVTAFDAEQSEGTHFLVMEFVEGVSLAKVVAERGQLPVRLACQYVYQAALGLQHAHERGMVHRDIKPHNLMLTPRGQVKVLDFGLARFLSESAPASGLTEQQVMMGTPDFVAPEQADDAHSADIRADIYSLGCTLYCLLAGRPPFVGQPLLQKLLSHRERNPQSVCELRKDIPPDLEQVLQRMLAKQAARRYQTPAEVARALAPFGGVDLLTAPTVVPTPIRPDATPGKVETGNRPRTRGPDWASITQPEKSGAAHPPDAASHWRLIGIVIALLAGAIVFAGVFLTIAATDKGQLIVETVDPNVEVIILKDGQKITIVDPKKRRQVALAPGDYSVELGERKKELQLSRNSFTLRRGDRQIVRVMEKSRPSPPPEPAGLIRPFELDGPPSTIVQMALSRDGLFAATAHQDHMVRVWNVTTGRRHRKLEGHTRQVWSVAFHPDGRRILSGGEDGLLRLWDIEAGTELRPPFVGHTNTVTCVAFSPDGRQAISSSEDRTLRLWNVETRESIRVFKGHSAGILSVAISPDGRTAVSSGWDKTVRLWNVETAEVIHPLHGHRAMVRSVAFSPDGERVLSGGHDGDTTLRLWDVKTGSQIRHMQDRSRWFHGVAFSPNGRWALTASNNGGGVVLWDLENEKRPYRFEPAKSATSFEHAMSATSVAFLPDGRQALSGGNDGRLHLWRLP